MTETDNLQRQKDAKWGHLLAEVARILDDLPLVKTVKWGADVYTHQGKNVVSYAAFKEYVALWFYNGVFLTDPANCLISAQEGKTKALRQWRIQTLAELDEPRLREYVREAMEVAEKGWKVAPEVKPLPDLPTELQNALADDADFATAFEQLSPGGKREYISYIAEAKREATRASRMVKIYPMILANKGLNDSYKKGNK